MALKIKKTTMLTRKFQLGFCGDWVEIYERTPHPKHAGAFFLAFRKRFGRKVLPLFWGITAGGARVMTENFKMRRYNPTELCLLIASKFSNQFVPLSVR